jgi:biotin-dependent carboxylase-like uncharacterized protein
VTSNNRAGMKVLRPGILTLIQDLGRFGYHDMGLTNGGPMDRNAFLWANRLCKNDIGATALEASFGGLVLEAQFSGVIAVTGAAVNLSINGVARELWCSHYIMAGDVIKFGSPKTGCRSYLAVGGGFDIANSFSSSATVVREKMGGLNGSSLRKDEFLPCKSSLFTSGLRLPLIKQPKYESKINLRLVLGYQHLAFNDLQLQRFFNSEFIVSNQSDRMGYRLQGPKISASVGGILSEGICHGSVQIPPDGQPIILLNDRQTIGGYPKIGSVMSIDTDKLAQLLPGGKVTFDPVTMEHSHELLREEKIAFQQLRPESF